MRTVALSLLCGFGVWLLGPLLGTALRLVWPPRPQRELVLVAGWERPCRQWPDPEPTDGEP